MKDKYQKVQTLSATEAVAQQLLEMINSGAITPGEQLPSEEELCKAFGVSRSSVREAKRILIAKNILESVSGKGTFVIEKSVDEVLSNHIVHNLLADDTKAYLQEARGMIEMRSAELAVDRADEHDLYDLSEILDVMKSEADEGKLAYVAGLDFHKTLIATTHNPVFTRLYDVIANLLLVHQEDDYIEVAEPFVEYVEHKNLYDALVNRDRENMLELMKHHLEYVRKIERGDKMPDIENLLEEL